jgi:tetrapyrrole methylase family protein / MazG family protein
VSDVAGRVRARADRAQIDVVGLGPAGPELVTTEAALLLDGPDDVYLRTTRHPAAAAYPSARSFDHRYEQEPEFEGVYRAIADDLVAAARDRRVVYAVPGSPTVAERSVELLRAHPAVTAGEIHVDVHPALSFVDLACARVGADPMVSGLRVVDAASFAVAAAGADGPLLVAQCWNRGLLSEVKLAVEDPPTAPVTVLRHLGLPDEEVFDVAWDDLDRSFEPDHLTSLWIPPLDVPIAGELVALEELVRTLRARCPWDRVQTHGSLARHLLEESYEVLEAIDAIAALDAAAAHDMAGGGAPVGHVEGQHVVEPAEETRAVAHLQEELGDLLFQVYFHATLAAEEGRFTLADVARQVREKLVARHPHVFGDVSADTPDDVATNWEAIKKAEKGRTSVTEGIPAALPALALAAKLQRKGVAVGMDLPSLDMARRELTDAVARLCDDGRDPPTEVADALFSLVDVARLLGVDPETELRARAARFRAEVERHG